MIFSQCFFTGQLINVGANTSHPIELKAREFEVFTVAAVTQLSNGAAFAPIGLIKMFNSGGSIKQFDYDSKKTGIINLRIRGCGSFGAYSSLKPKRITMDNIENQDFNYDQNSGLLTLDLPVAEAELYNWNIAIEL